MLRQSEEGLRDGAAGLRRGSLILLGERIPAMASAFYGTRGLRLLLNTATALLVLSLPLTAATSAKATTATPTETVALASISSVTDDGAARAATSARGLLAGSRSLVTIAASDVPEIPSYTVKKGDTLSDIAATYGVDTDDVAFANHLDTDSIGVGDVLVIPPGHGALYVVKTGDTVPSVASKFKVDPSVIMTYNRLYFEPEHFAIDQLIFVPGAAVPVVRRTNYGVASVPLGQLPARTGRLSWPVGGVLTQYYWWGHTGVDLAAPYGTTISSSDDGVVVATGWVAVGGLRVCVQHAGGLQTCYYHTSSVYVTPGQTVARGQPLAAIGMTGVTTGPHVHWEVKLNGVAVNPLAY
jgi:murein DD-endopeptidase MepM/ murein hydrolase activator NlpD